MYLLCTVLYSVLSYLSHLNFNCDQIVTQFMDVSILTKYISINIYVNVQSVRMSREEKRF